MARRRSRGARRSSAATRTKRSRSSQPPAGLGPLPSEPLRRATAVALGVLRPLSPLSGSAWAEAYRHVPVGTSPEPGPWRSKPYQKAVLDAITDPAVEGVVYIACSQGGGKTEILLSTVGYYA